MNQSIPYFVFHCFHLRGTGDLRNADNHKTGGEGRPFLCHCYLSQQQIAESSLGNVLNNRAAFSCDAN